MIVGLGQSRFGRSHKVVATRFAGSKLLRRFSARSTTEFLILYIETCSLIRSSGRMERIGVRRSHTGDWIVDEILLTEEGRISHEISFSERGGWKIVCADLFHQWRDIAPSGD